MLEFVWPVAFFLIYVPMIFRWLVPPAEPRNVAALKVPQIEAFQFESAIGVSRRNLRRWRNLALFWLGWILLVTALARPQYTGDPVELPLSGRNLVLAIDISLSMEEDDMKYQNQRTTRLNVVKQVVSDFLEKRAGDRVGIILFGTHPYYYIPLTFDLTSVNRMLEAIPAGIAGKRTAIGDAVGLAVKHLQNRPEKDRVVVLLTDGEQNAGELSQEESRELASAYDVKVHAISVNPSRSLPSVFGLFDRLIPPLSTRENERLKAVAEGTGGRYFRATNTEQLQEIYDLINEMEPTKQEDKTFRPIKALYYWPLSAGLALLLLLWLSSVRNGV